MFILHCYCTKSMCLCFLKKKKKKSLFVLVFIIISFTPTSFANFRALTIATNYPNLFKLMHHLVVSEYLYHLGPSMSILNFHFWQWQLCCMNTAILARYPRHVLDTGTSKCRHHILYPLWLEPPFPNDSKILKSKVGLGLDQIKIYLRKVFMENITLLWAE